ncbi:MAG: NTP transferase domain-containing protein, partial [Pseudomonadota bacterium]
MPILTVIPARMAASRLPGKPLADIHGTPMIVHVWQRALAAELGPVLVATDNAQIAKAIEAVGGTAVMTSPDHPSGSDRIWEAVQRFDPDGANDAILNLQGDLPTIDAATVRACAETRAATGADIATLAAQIRSEAEHNDPNVVKVVGAHQTLANGDGRAPEGNPRNDSALKECQRAL